MQWYPHFTLQRRIDQNVNVGSRQGHERNEQDSGNDFNTNARACNYFPEYGIVRAMNGVGDVLAPRLITEIGDVRCFHSGSGLIAFTGIDSPPYQSGSFTGTQRKISKRGSSLLRKTGYEVMKCLKTVKPSEDAAVYQYMMKKDAEGKPKKVAKIAALNKFLRIYYARVSEVYTT